YLGPHDEGNTFHLCSPKDGEELSRLKLNNHGDLSGIRFTEDDRVLTLGFKGGQIERWDLDARKCTYELDLIPSPPVDFDFTADQRMAMRAGHQIALWDLDTRHYLALLKLADTCRNLEFSPDGRQLVTTAEIGRASC